TQDIFYGANGNKTQQYDFNLDKSYVWHVFVADGSQTATLYGANGQIIEYASFNAYGFETQDIFYGANGNKTQQYDFSLDGSYVRHDFNTDGSQTASLIGANGKLTEYAAFNASGFKTQDIFYGTNGNKTQQYDFNLDNSYVWHVFNTDGSQTAALYGANGQIVEYASFNAYGFETQDIFYGANGNKTQQYDFSLDGSYVRHDFGTDGSQTALVVGANGKLTELATFNPYGFKTQDIFYGTDGNKTQQYDFKMDGSYTYYKFNSDNSQSVALFGTNGQVIEYANFNANGFKTQEIFYGSDGKATKLFDFNPTGGYTSHIFNPDGSQIAALYGPNGVITEYASFDSSGFKAQDIFYTNGTMKQLYDFSLDGSYTSHTFNGGVELVGLFGSNNLLHDYYQFSGGKLFERDFFDSLGREIEADRYSTSNGQLTGFTQYQYNADRSYVARDYDSDGHLIAQSQYAGDGQWLRNDSVYIPGNGGSFPVVNWSTGAQF
ncbi:MAG TPA: hypothetical protein VHU21_06130, partial [Paraburkholderia sp.]|nr:hypothetical protein [Paraburkholderia sp.]